MLASKRQDVCWAKNKVGKQVWSLTSELFTSQLKLTCDFGLERKSFDSL